MKSFLFITLTLLLVTGCSSNQRKFDSKEFYPIKESNDPILKLETYEKKELYFGNDQEHFKKFLDKYFDKLTILDRKDKSYYLNLFNSKNFPKPFLNWINNTMKAFEEMPILVHDGKVFNFFMIDNNKDKTIYYIHGNVSPLMYWAEFAKNMVDAYKNEYNIVFIHSTNINLIEKSYTAEELNQAFEDDVKDFMVKSGYDKTKNYFNPVCHSALFSYSFFVNNPNLYENVIYYAPMIKKSKLDVVQDISNFFPKDQIMDEFYTVYYLYALTTPKGIRTFYIPKELIKFNIQTEKNLTQLYFKGLDISKIEKKSLIYAENDSMLNHESYSMDLFSKNRIKQLDNMGHHDYFSIKERRPLYFEYLSNFMK